MSSRVTRWRVVACLMFIGLVANVIVGILFVTSVLTSVAARTRQLLLWIPPASEFLFPTIHTIGQLKGHTTLLVACFVIPTVISALLIVGLWNAKRWAAWATTGLMLFTLASSVYVIATQRLPFRWLLRLGHLQALTWTLLYVVLLWFVPITAALRVSKNFLQSFRR